MVRSGDRLAHFAVRASSNISRILSASQLGVTLASLGLGWVAESTVGEVFEHLFANLPFAVELSMRLTLAATVALILVTYLHVVFGELVPKAAALNHPESLARWLAPPLLFFAWITTPFTFFLNKSSQVILRALGQEKRDRRKRCIRPRRSGFSSSSRRKADEMQAHDADLIDAVFEFSEKTRAK